LVNGFSLKKSYLVFIQGTFRLMKKWAFLSPGAIARYTDDANAGSPIRNLLPGSLL